MDKSIFISKADKGKAVVIQNTEDYIKKVSEILDLEGKFKRLDKDPTVEQEKSLHGRYY